jgi:thiol-disulfide isomerase/thioredoxin
MSKGKFKANLVILILGLTFFSCDFNKKGVTVISDKEGITVISDKEGITVISGEITNPIGNTIEITGQDVSIEIKINEDGTFRDTLNISSSYYNLAQGRERTQVYLEPKYNLTITLDTEYFDESISFNGIGSENNNFLKDKFLHKEVNLLDIPSIFKLDETEFMAKINEIKKSDYEFINKYSSISTEFRDLEIKSIDYSYLQFLQRYPIYHEFYAKKPPVFGEKFMLPLEEISYTDDEDYKMFPTYKSLVIGHFQNVLEKSNNIKEDFRELKKMKSTIIKNDLVKQGSYMLSAGNKKNKEIFNTLVQLSNDSLLVNKLTNKFNVLSKLDKGMESPEFSDYENYNGGTTSLVDLKGKFVYIDVWATWCGPCIREIPSLQKVEEEYHDKNIYFVSMSIDERNGPKYNHEKWKEMIVEKNLTGIQLFADNAWKSKFTMAYGIDSIPRFLLIDPDGNIVSGNAPRPSDPALVELFNSLGF